jgi:glycosyltransferase involved in cell wall biosynthesis
MYTGNLSSAYGVDVLLEAMTHLSDRDCRLWLFGKGEMVEEILQASQRDPRITYWGFTSNEIVFQQSQLASVLINPRPLDATLTPYMFPSKLLEYMVSGVPVISTRLSGIPDEYFTYILPLDNVTPNGVASILRELKSLPHQERDKIGKKAQAFVIEQKTIGPQGERVWEFLKRLHDRH